MAGAGPPAPPLPVYVLRPVAPAAGGTNAANIAAERALEPPTTADDGPLSHAMWTQGFANTHTMLCRAAFSEQISAQAIQDAGVIWDAVAGAPTRERTKLLSKKDLGRLARDEAMMGLMATRFITTFRFKAKGQVFEVVTGCFDSTEKYWPRCVAAGIATPARALERLAETYSG